MTRVTTGLKCEPLTFIPIRITTAKPIAVAKALIKSFVPSSGAKRAAIWPEPTTAIAKIMVPKNSMANAF